MAVEKRTIPFPNSFGWEMGYDTSIVTIGDGSLSVDGVMVRGSRSFRRDPRLGRLVDERYRPQGRAGGSRPERTHIPNNEKWCCVCGDVRPKSYFSPRTDTFDKLDPRCKMCENERKRRAYAQKIGHEPRAYTRQELKAS